MTERQEQIILTAIALIAREGYKILLSKNSLLNYIYQSSFLYRHFVNKEDLLLSIMHYFEDISGMYYRKFRKLSSILRKSLLL